MLPPNSFSRYVLDAVKRIKESIDNEPLRYKTASALLEQVSGPNRNAVEKAFRAVYQCGIKEYQVRHRLEASKRFLEAGLTKKQVAGKCFYRSPSAYAAAFKKHFQITPTEYLLQLYN